MKYCGNNREVQFEKLTGCHAQIFVEKQQTEAVYLKENRLLYNNNNSKTLLFTFLIISGLLSCSVSF